MSRENISNDTYAQVVKNEVDDVHVCLQQLERVASNDVRYACVNRELWRIEVRKFAETLLVAVTALVRTTALAVDDEDHSS